MPTSQPVSPARFSQRNLDDQSRRGARHAQHAICVALLAIIGLFFVDALSPVSVSAQSGQSAQSVQSAQVEEPSNATPELRINNRRDLRDHDMVMVRITSNDSEWRIRQCAGDICESPQTKWTRHKGSDRRMRAFFDRMVGDVDCVTAVPRCEVQLFSRNDRDSTVHSLPLHFDPAGPSGITEVRASKIENLRSGETVRVSTSRGIIRSVHQCTTDAAGNAIECTALNTNHRQNVRVTVQRGLVEQDCAGASGRCVLRVALAVDGRPAQRLFPLHFDPDTPAPQLLDIFLDRYDDLIDGQPLIVRVSGVNHVSAQELGLRRDGLSDVSQVTARQCAVVDGELVIESCGNINGPSIAVVDGMAEFDGPVRRILKARTSGETYDCALDECVVVFKIGGGRDGNDPMDGAIFRWRTVRFDPLVDLNPPQPRIRVNVERMKRQSQIELAVFDFPKPFYRVAPRLCGIHEATGEKRCRVFMSDLTADRYGNAEESRTIRRAEPVVRGVDCRRTDCWFEVRGVDADRNRYEAISEPFRI